MVETVVMSVRGPSEQSMRGAELYADLTHLNDRAALDLMLTYIAAHAERQTELLERIAAAIPGARPEPEKIDPHAPAHERGV